MNPALVMFGIEAGVKLGRKINDVLVDETVERSLLLPVGDLYADIDEVRAVEYFDAHPELTAPAANGKPKGPYNGYSKKNLVLAYKTLRSIDERVSGAGGDMREATDILAKLAQFEQYKKGYGSRPPVQRILGTVVEIGIDYFDANPDAIGKDSRARRIIEAFVSELDDTDFAEGSRREIVGDLLGASLRTLDTNLPLIEDDERTRALLGGITQAFIADVDALTEAGTSLAGLERREDLLKRIGSSFLRGAAGAFTESISLFVRDESPAKTLVQSTLTQVLEGIKGKEDIFTNESLELVYKSALNTVADNPDLFSDDVIIQELIGQTVTALAKANRVFSDETFGAVLQAALEVVRENAEMLVDPDDPQEHLLASAVGAMASSLASTLAGGGTAKDLLSKSQLVDLTSIVFNEVASHPEHLIGADSDDVKMTALAQILGSVARALGDEPGLLVNGAGFVQLARGAIHVAVLNADKLIDFSEANTSRNLLYKVLHQVAVVFEDQDNDPRGLVTREVFIEIVDRVLPLVSANLEPLLDDQPSIVGNTVRTALGLAEDKLQNRTNGANLPLLIEELLRQALWGELNLTEKTAVLDAATAALREAA